MKKTNMPAREQLKRILFNAKLEASEEDWEALSLLIMTGRRVSDTPQLGLSHRKVMALCKKYSAKTGYHITPHLLRTLEVIELHDLGIHPLVIKNHIKT